MMIPDLTGYADAPIVLLAFGWILPAIMGVAGLFGGAARGQGQERTNRNDFTQTANQQALTQQGITQNAMTTAMQGEERGALDRAGLDLSRRNFTLNAPSTRARQSVMGSLMQSRPSTINRSSIPSAVRSRMPTMSGGPQMTGDTRQLGALMARLALQDQLRGDTFADVPATNFRSAVLPPAQQQGYQNPGTLEQILGWLGLAGGAAGAVGSARAGRPPSATPPMGAG